MANSDLTSASAVPGASDGAYGSVRWVNSSGSAGGLAAAAGGLVGLARGLMGLDGPGLGLTGRELAAWAQGCQMAKLDPFLSLDCARVAGRGGGAIQ